MNDRKSVASSSARLIEEVRRGWYWVVFVISVLGRVGGIKEWIQTLKRLVNLLSSRAKGTVKVLDGRSFYEASEFPFAGLLESNWEIILKEVSDLQGEYFIPWSEKYLYKEGWSTFGLYAYGVKISKNCDLCPETTRLLEQIPNLTTAGFSALAPGTSIAPHTGYPDGVLRCHLGLVIPSDCALRVGQDVQAWENGKCLIFDDTAEHEAWNRSDRTRVVLLLDFAP